MVGTSAVTPAAPSSLGSHAPYHASPIHARRPSGDSGLTAMQVAHTPQALVHGGGTAKLEDERLGPMSRPIDVPRGMTESFVRTNQRGSRASGMGESRQDLLARSMGYPISGSRTSFPLPGATAAEDPEFNKPEGSDAYSYTAASFSMGGGGGNHIASDFGYALQRPGIRYEALYKQQSPSSSCSEQFGHGAGSASMHVDHHGPRSGIGHDIPHRSSFAGYNQRLRGHERGGRAMSMDQNATPLAFCSGGISTGGMSSHGLGPAGAFGPQSLRYSSQQPRAPPAYTPLASGNVLGSSLDVHGDVARAPVAWGRNLGFYGCTITGSPRAQSTSPPIGRCDVEFSPDPLAFNMWTAIEPPVAFLPTACPRRACMRPLPARPHCTV